MQNTSLERNPDFICLPDDVRLPLLEAARAFERRVGRSVGDPEDALLAHHAIELDRCRLVADETRDGRRLLILEATGDLARGPLLPELPEREGKAAAYSALGHGFKVIGHELGVSVPTVSRLLARARRTLGLSSHAALVAMAHARARERVGG
jgi:DNA-binding CsgD family transcriptional regulator